MKNSFNKKKVVDKINNMIEKLNKEVFIVIFIIVTFSILFYWIFRFIFNINEITLVNYNIGYLSFMGTTIMGFITLYSTNRINVTNLNEKKSSIFFSKQPVFIIEILNNNSEKIYDIENTVNRIRIKNVSNNVVTQLSIDYSYYINKLEEKECTDDIIITFKENSKIDNNVNDKYILYDIECMNKKVMLPKKIEILYFDCLHNYVGQEFILDNFDNFYLYELKDHYIYRDENC